jgi:hypothetical protein
VKMQIRQIFGIGLVILGVLLVANFLPLTGIMFPSKFWWSTFPSGTQSAPTLLKVGTSYMIEADLVFVDKAAGVTLPSPADGITNWEVSCSITFASGASYGSIPLTTTATSFYWSKDNNYEIAPFTGAFIPASNEVGVATCAWTAIVEDKYGTVYGTETLTTYAAIYTDPPDGYFTLAGVQITSTTQSILVNSSTLPITFVPTAHADQITEVYFTIAKGSGAATKYDLLKQTDGSYSYTYTLPSAGTYTIYGYFVWSMNPSTPLQKMSIIALNGGGPGLPSGWNISNAQILGVISIAVGVVLIFYKRGAEKEK